MFKLMDLLTPLAEDVNARACDIVMTRDDLDAIMKSAPKTFSESGWKLSPTTPAVVGTASGVGS